MKLIADGGSTKADWVAINNSGTEIFRTQTLGINPAILTENDIKDRVANNDELKKFRNEIRELYFYGAGCGTDSSKLFLKNAFSTYFENADIHVHEDMLAAVYAASGGKESIVCILGTGSNSCFFDGRKMFQKVVSLGYMLMDEASANYFGKQLIRDYFYKKMPLEISETFKNKFNLDPDEIKRNLYKEASPNSYLGEFATILFEFKDDKYVRDLLKKGFREFYECRVLCFENCEKFPIYFIGSIAFYFEDLLKEVAKELNLKFGGVIQRPIDGLIEYHRK